MRESFVSVKKRGGAFPGYLGKSTIWTHIFYLLLLSMAERVHASFSFVGYSIDWFPDGFYFDLY